MSFWLSPRLDLPLAAAAWCFGFGWVRLEGDWTWLTLLALGCSVRLLAGDPATRALLRPSFRGSAIGLLAAALMTAATIGLYGLLGRILPFLRADTSALYHLFRTGGPPRVPLPLLLVLMSACEEIIWRGRTLGSCGDDRQMRTPSTRDLTRVATRAAVYGLAHLPSLSPTLVCAALACGLVWGFLRVASRSLWTPIVTHALWDLALLVIWPIA